MKSQVNMTINTDKAQKAYVPSVPVIERPPVRVVVPIKYISPISTAEEKEFRPYTEFFANPRLWKPYIEKAWKQERERHHQEVLNDMDKHGSYVWRDCRSE